MYTVPLRSKFPGDDAPFRDAVRRCIALDLAPNQVMFVEGDADALFESLPEVQPAPFKVPRGFATLMEDVLCHRALDRFALLYQVLWRLRRGEERLLERASDPTVSRLRSYAQAVGRDIHKMHAFVRFRERVIEGETVFVAWFEPQHYVLRKAAPFFADRFAGMPWLIATPIGTASWRDGALAFGEPLPRPPEEGDAVLDALWLTYYRTTFNPARLRTKAMTREMPKHYWANMPETAAIPDLVAQAGTRTQAMIAAAPDQPPRYAEKARRHAVREPGVAFEPMPSETMLLETPSIEALRREAGACTRCPLHAAATQTVFGEGPADAPVVFVGEQPGDQEDIAGKPFVGPAGQVFDRALAEAGIDRERVYVTNAVKHFKYEPRGKRRLHKKPSGGEIERCRWWLDRELAAIEPRLVVALGATAATALAGRTIAVTRERGRPLAFAGRPGLITVHPSYLLRLPEPGAALEYRRFVEDLRMVAEQVREVRLAA